MGMFLILGHKDPPLNKAQIMPNMYIYRTDQKIACSLVQEDRKTSQLLENPQYIAVHCTLQYITRYVVHQVLYMAIFITHDLF
jgi:hypothetical protein